MMSFGRKGAERGEQRGQTLNLSLQIHGEIRGSVPGVRKRVCQGHSLADVCVSVMGADVVQRVLVRSIIQNRKKSYFPKGLSAHHLNSLS